MAIQSLAGTESIAAVAASIDIRLLWTVCLLDMSAIFLGLKKNVAMKIRNSGHDMCEGFEMVDNKL